RATRHLPSFPTRRSSDLSVYPSARERPDSAELQPFAVASNGVTSCSRRSAVQLGFFSFQPSTTRRPARSIVKLTGNRQIRPYPGDRKSTRLNSSHVAISY